MLVVSSSDPNMILSLAPASRLNIVTSGSPQKNKMGMAVSGCNPKLEATNQSVTIHHLVILSVPDEAPFDIS